MARQLPIVTPENVPIDRELAGLGTRFGALLIDLALLGSSMFILWVVGAVLIAALSVADVENLGIALLIVASFVLFFGYFIAFETATSGQTPGKRALGIRVVTDDGFPLTFFPAATRNLVRVADFLPVAFGAGAVSAFCHPQHKRLGDLVAGTVVVKEPRSFRFRRGESQSRSAGSGAEPMIDPRQALTRAELELLRRFDARRWEMAGDDSERLAYRLVAPLLPRLPVAFPPDGPPRYADLVSRIVARADDVA